MDYYREYLQSVEELLDDFVKRNYTKLYVGSSCMAKAVKNNLWVFLVIGEYRKYYNEKRNIGCPIIKLKHEIYENCLSRFEIEGENSCFFLDEKRYENFDILNPYQGSIVILCKNIRQMNYWKPIITQITSPILLLCDFECEDNVGLYDNITVLELSFLRERFIQNAYLEKNFPLIFAYANLFTMVIEIVKPTRVMVMEGCHEESEVLAALARSAKIETVCYQQGWPSVMHTRFQNMGYDQFVTWGEGFNALWQPYNPSVAFETGRYPYEKYDIKVGHAITFFLQAPVIISDEVYCQEMLSLIVYVAKTCTECKFLIREHPEYRLGMEQKKRFSLLQNVELVTDLPLAEVFRRTQISVSMFSSTLIESIVHLSVPFVFDPSTSGEYYPKVNNWGINTHSLEEAKEKLTWIINDEKELSKLVSNVRLIRDHFFSF